MSDKLIVTDYGIISERVTALVTTDDGALLVVGEKSYTLKNSYRSITAEPIKSRSERVANKFGDFIERFIVSVEEFMYAKKFKSARADYWKSLEEIRGLKAEIVELKKAKQAIDPTATEETFQ